VLSAGNATACMLIIDTLVSFTIIQKLFDLNVMINHIRRCIKSCRALTCLGAIQPLAIAFRLIWIQRQPVKIQPVNGVRAGLVVGGLLDEAYMQTSYHRLATDQRNSSRLSLLTMKLTGRFFRGIQDLVTLILLFQGIFRGFNCVSLSNWCKHLVWVTLVKSFG
jgi:hypothetical protein